LEDETVWLTQKMMAELFDKDVRTINEHIQNVFDEQELDSKAVIRNFRITASDGKSYNSQHYSLAVWMSSSQSVTASSLAKLLNSASGPPATTRRAEARRARLLVAFVNVGKSGGQPAHTAVRVLPPGSVQGYRMRSLKGRPANFGSEALVLQM
jgi:hypothetical protein